MKKITFEASMKDEHFNTKWVSGHVAFKMYGFTWVVHRRIDYIMDSLWDISEYVTGASLPLGEVYTQREAIEKGKTMLIDKGEKFIKDSVSKTLEIIGR